tara:strand:- start:4839 stop:5906 length:1068 start_codon:yes stop_codon:yes gene_type:complete
MALPFPILDPHIHLWEPRSTPRQVSPAVKLLGWNERLIQSLGPKLFPRAAIDFVGVIDHVASPYLPGTYLAESEGWEVRGFVHVQAGWHAKGDLAEVDETRWLEALCGRDLLAIVGEARLGAGELDRVLDGHAAASARFVGVRDMTAHHADSGVLDWDARGAGTMDDPAWRAGLRRLGERGLTFDAWMYAGQLGAFERALQEAPETPVMLCHLGSPVGAAGPYARQGANAAERERIVAAWERDLRAVAAHPRVHAKISGLAMPVLGFDWHRRSAPPSVGEVVDGFAPFVEVALDAFGPERCLFASNFPMDKASLPWTTLYAAFEQLAPSDPATQRALFHDNAARFYGLDPAAPAE